jgi:hypothetical protein
MGRFASVEGSFLRVWGEFGPGANPLVSGGGKVKISKGASRDLLQGERRKDKAEQSPGRDGTVNTPIWKSRIKAAFAAGLVLICWLSSPAFALDETYGSEWRCTDWLEARDRLTNWIKTPRHPPGEEKVPTDTHIPRAWIIGFVEGYRWGCMITDIAPGLDTNGVLERVDRICRAGQPTDQSLLNAVLTLTKHLRAENASGDCLSLK